MGTAQCIALVICSICSICVRLWGEPVVQRAAGGELAVGEKVGAVRLAVDGERVDVGAVAIGLDADTAAAGQV